MKRIFNLLLVRRPETQNKWWHRFALVLIYGSTIVMAIFLASLIIEEAGDDWVKHQYSAYSFEKGYITAKGKEVDCKFSVTSLRNLPPISTFRCGDIFSNTEFLNKYSQARGTFERLQELRGNLDSRKLDISAFEGKYVPIAERVKRPEAKSDSEIMAELIQSGELAELKVKRVTNVDYVSLLGTWGLYILAILGWLVFWESIVYRTILFVVYGRRNG